MGYEDTSYDWVAPTPQRRAQAQAVVARWIALRRRAGAAPNLGFLLSDQGEGEPHLTAAIFEQLARSRDDRPVEVRE